MRADLRALGFHSPSAIIHCAASRQRACARGGRPASRRPGWGRSRDSGCGLVPTHPGERRRTGRRPRRRETSPDGPSARYRAIRRLICRMLRPSWRAASRYRNCLLNHPHQVHCFLCHRNGLLCHRPSRNQKGIFENWTKGALRLWANKTGQQCVVTAIRC